jgi:hypothetical protein
MSQQTVDLEVVRYAPDAFDWDELPNPPGDDAPPGEETILFRSADGKMSCGFWRRVAERGHLAPPFDEIMQILDGEVDIHQGDDTERVGPGDILVAPNGADAIWDAVTPVFKFWSVFQGGVSDTAVSFLHPKEGLRWQEASIPPDDGYEAGREVVAFRRGPFSCGLWERDQQDRDFERPYDEVAVILEGEVEITTPDGRTLLAGPRDVMITPKGSRGHWKSPRPVRKFWTIYES